MLIIKLGGSVIQNSLTEINPEVVKLVQKISKDKIQCLISAGGGKICRFFQNSLKDNGVQSNDLLDWMGIASVNLNAEYIRCLFNDDLCYGSVIKSEEIYKDALINKDNYPFFVCGAWEVGHSSDHDAVDMAIAFGSDTVLRMSDVNFVYDSDPKHNPNAKKLEKISWDEYLNIIGNPNWVAGSSYPVDPVAAKRAKEHNLKFVFASVEQFLAMEKIDFENFDGTVIS
jgi:uridylate kinase